MKNVLFISVCLLCCFSCGLIDNSGEDIDCPYEFTLFDDAHVFQIPIEVSPHRMQYSVGDTITFSSIFSDSLYDMNTKLKFKIEGFPFQPYSYLFRFRNDTLFRFSYTLNEVIVPEENNPRIISDTYTDAVFGESAYRDETYNFQIQMVLQTPGKYVFLLRDKYNDNRLLGRHELNEEADAIDFEGKCDATLFLAGTIIGDDHVDQCYDELFQLDERVFSGAYIDADGEEKYADGGLFRRWQWEGAFCFEVTE